MRSSHLARRSSGPPWASPGPRRSAARSTSASSAGKRVIIERNAITIAVPATTPNSSIPVNSVSRSTKNAPAAVRALSSMPGPARSAARRSAPARVRVDAPLLLVAVEEVDAVVGADADDDGDEHHGEDAEVADHEGDDPHRPGQAHGQGSQHEHGLHHAPEGQQQEARGWTRTPAGWPACCRRRRWPSRRWRWPALPSPPPARPDTRHAGRPWPAGWPRSSRGSPRSCAPPAPAARTGRAAAGRTRRSSPRRDRRSGPWRRRGPTARRTSRPRRDAPTV